MPNTALWEVLGQITLTAKRYSLAGDITPEPLKPDVRRYRRVWRHDGKGWVPYAKGANK